MLGNSRRGDREAPAAPVGQQGGGPEGERDERQVPYARCRGVGGLRSTCEGSEQWSARIGGGTGGKAARQGELRGVQPEPDAESGDRVTRARRSAGSSEEGPGTAVYRPAASRNRAT